MFTFKYVVWLPPGTYLFHQRTNQNHCFSATPGSINQPVWTLTAAMVDALEPLASCANCCCLVSFPGPTRCLLAGDTNPLTTPMKVLSCSETSDRQFMIHKMVSPIWIHMKFFYEFKPTYLTTFSSFSKTMTNRSLLSQSLRAELVVFVFKKRALGVQLGFLGQHAFLESAENKWK